MKNFIFLAFVSAVIVISGCTSLQEDNQPLEKTGDAESNAHEGLPEDNFQDGGDYKEDIYRMRQSDGCQGKGYVNFTSPPRKLEDIEIIQPIGLMIGNHVTPVDHGYYYPPGWKWPDDPKDFKDVFSPADGIITEISLVGNVKGDYRMIIHHTCDFYTIYIHLKGLSGKIMDEAGEVTRNINPQIEVSAGELIGMANSFDFSVHYDRIVLKGFITPELYEGEPWKIHTVDMFDYFVEPIRSQLLSKNLRQVQPRGGKIDFDIDGRLVGNWFVENTNGYSGRYGLGPDYWETHLSFAYNAIDPSLVTVSIGDFKGGPKQFAVKGNSPDPADVSVSSGIVI